MTLGSPCEGTLSDRSPCNTSQELFEDPPRVNIFIADQSDREMWRAFRKQMRRDKIFFDVILDDGALASLMQFMALTRSI